jgi:predicted enzyme related to lactoylglutathione lyase
MGERDGYQHGVPCWVTTVHTDPEAAVGFYTELFGWEADDVMPANSPARYFMCKLRGRDVAAVGGPPREGAPPAPAWRTYIWVDSADDTAAKSTDAGGSVVMAPFDSLDACRMAVRAVQLGGKAVVPPYDAPGFREAVLADRGCLPGTGRVGARDDHGPGRRGGSSSSRSRVAGAMYGAAGAAGGAVPGRVPRGLR